MRKEKNNLPKGDGNVRVTRSTRGRKGKADTALRTADSGYLTRKLCDASQEVVVRDKDCGTQRIIIVSKQEAESQNEDFYNVIYGRVLAEEVKDKK